MTYFFILGKHPELSKAEIHTVLTRMGNPFTVRDAHGAVLILESAQPIESREMNHILGGVTKMGEVMTELPIGHSRIDVATTYLETFDADAVLARGERRTEFGFSVYSLTSSAVPYRFAQKLLREGISLKKRLKEKRGNVRFVTSKHHDLSSVIIGENYILETGGDLCFFLGKDRIFVGMTRAIQPYREYSERDYGRPARDARSGMLPPKLAQMMVNLSAGDPVRSALLDPFCGSGTIVQEALLLGYTHLIGSDISEDAIRNSHANLTWLKSHARVKRDARLLRMDVRGLAGTIRERSIDAIVTEPYLGSPLRGGESEAFMTKTKKNLEQLYADALSVFRVLLRPGGRLVMVVPTFVIRAREYPLVLPWQGFRDVSFPSWIDRRGFMYARSDQHVQRNIVVKEYIPHGL